MNYRPRLDFVLLRVTERGVSIGGVALPEISKESKKTVVVAVGPDVVDGLKAGDEVLLIGTVGQDVVQLPREKNLLVTKQANVILVVESE